MAPERSTFVKLAAFAGSDGAGRDESAHSTGASLPGLLVSDAGSLFAERAGGSPARTLAGVKEDFQHDGAVHTAEFTVTVHD